MSFHFLSGDGDGGDNKHDASTTSSTGSAEAQAVKQRDAQRLDDDATQQSAVTGLEMDVEAEEHGVDPIQRERDEHDVDMESIDVDSYVEEDERESRSEEGCDSEVDELGVSAKSGGNAVVRRHASYRICQLDLSSMRV